MAGTCTTKHDCSLLGDCVGGACVCDAGFKGITCCELDLAPASRDGGYRNHSQTSWGGQVLKGTPATGGFYHNVMYASAFVNNCSLKEFGTNSESVHAVSPTPGGPFRLADIALPPFHHSTTAIQAPDGSLSGKTPAGATCTRVVGSRRRRRRHRPVPPPPQRRAAIPGRRVACNASQPTAGRCKTPSAGRRRASTPLPTASPTSGRRFAARMPATTVWRRGTA